MEPSIGHKTSKRKLIRENFEIAFTLPVAYHCYSIMKLSFGSGCIVCVRTGACEIYTRAREPVCVCVSKIGTYANGGVILHNETKTSLNDR